MFCTIACVFSVPGVYSARLTASNSAGEDTYALDNCIQAGGKHTTWDQVQYSDSWIANVSDNVSMAIAPLLDYSGNASAIAPVAAGTVQDSRRVAVYSLGGQRVASPQKGSIYVVRYADGTSRKVVW